MNFKSVSHLKSYISKIVFNNTGWRCNGECLSNACAYSLLNDNKRYRLIEYAKNTKDNFKDLESNEMRRRFNKFCKSLIN